MGTRSTWGLIALLSLLLLWIWRAEGPTQPTTGPLPPVLLADASERIARVELIVGAQTTTATRAPSGWLDLQGRPFPHDAVTDLLVTLATLRPLRTIAPEPNEAPRYAIGQRRLRIVRDDGSVALDLELGNANPAQTALYARMTGQPDILMIGAVLAWDIGKLETAARGDATP